VTPTGPANARVLIVGEAPGELEVMRGMPFCGPSGNELDRMLAEVGLLRTQCFVTNVCNERPPRNEMDQWVCFLKNAPHGNKKYSNTNWVRWRDAWVHPAVVAGYQQLLQHIEAVRPTLVIALGNTALYALTGKRGIKSWRGSMLSAKVGDHTFKVIPTYHPSAVLRDWSIRALTIHDLRRAERESHTATYTVPNNPRIIRPNFGQVCTWLADLRRRLTKGPVFSSTDIETRAGQIACTGFYIKGMPTLCIPWMCVERPEGYWSPAEELYLWTELQSVMTHPNFRCIGQNWLYDAQYKWRWFFIEVMPYWDTMTAHHCMFPGTPKGLDVLASMHCQHYVYWKDDGKNWDPKVGEDQLWIYNCEDCERTYEVYESQQAAILPNPRLSKVWEFQTKKLTKLLFKAMRRGIRADVKNKARLSSELDGEIKTREAWLQGVVGHPLNIRSPKQMAEFFYTDLKQKEVLQRKGQGRGNVTTDDEALATIAKREPLLGDVVRTVQELRSIGVFKSTFVEARLDRDQRIRCSFNLSGTVTFRLSSSENAFGSGLNLQNIPSGSEDDDDALKLPNIRKLFVPDEGQIIFDIDLKNADFYTVVWEADDEIFRRALELGVDMHLLNAGTVFGIKELDFDHLLDPEFITYGKKKYKKQRDFSKRWVHGTDFGGGDRTMAATVGITVRENERFRLKWFSEHPGIKRWHERTEHQIKTQRYVENKFGYRWYIFDRVDGILPEALAWVPQSTTGCVINRAWEALDQQLPAAEVLIQVHDSLVGQYPAAMQSEMLTRIPEVAKVVVPYDRPLVIPVGIKTSPISWGHCE
jgi:DNA polymerase I-like protein with 3'-5' exonuclease and polymerase domains/uracil-DNA glycosylase